MHITDSHFSQPMPAPSSKQTSETLLKVWFSRRHMIGNVAALSLSATVRRIGSESKFIY